MAENSSTSPLSEVKTSSSPRPRALNRLRKRFSKENKSSPNLLGVKIKRFSELENYSGSSRGTLGGFSPLPDMGSPDIDSLCLEKQKNVEKECVLTQLTKKIGLGIYTRGRDTPAEKELRDHVDMNGDDRETWYMFYPPPPSPSLAIEPEDGDSTSSLEPDSASSSSPVPIAVSEADIERKGLPRLSAFTQESDYATSNPTSPVSPTDHRRNIDETNQDIDIDALILSAESLAEQYRGLLLTPSAATRLTSFYPHSTNALSPLPFPSPLSFHPPSRPQTPKTLRKIKRQHSLRKLLDAPASSTIHHRSLPSPTTPNTLPTNPVQKPYPLPNLLTPPPSATNPPPFSPLTPPPPAIRSPDFLSSTFTPEPLHPTRLSLAAHPNRSPTPSQGAGRAKKRKARRDGAEAGAPEPPPRESSRGRGGGRGGRGKEKKGTEKIPGGKGSRARDGDGWKREGKDRDRELNGEMRIRGVSDVTKTGGGGGVNEGGEGWL